MGSRRSSRSGWRRDVDDVSARLGIQLQLEFTTPAAVLRAAREAEEVGVDSVWVWDHLMPHRQTFGVDGPHLEMWTMLVAIAAATRHVAVGPLAANANVRGNPRVFALAVKTLSDIAPGRVHLMIGAGWYEPELQLYNVPTTPRHQKAARLVSWIRDFRDRWEQLSSEDLPIALAGGALPILRAAAAEGLGWNYYGWDSTDPLADFGCRSSLYRDLCTGTPAGRSRAKISALVDASSVDRLPDYVECGADEVIVSVDHTSHIRRLVGRAKDLLG